MISEILDRVRRERPLVHHITNWVTIYDCANIVRAFGALPVMAHAIEEAADMAGISSALVLNIGTLTPELIESMISAGLRANDRGIPVVLDAVGVGATRLRNEKAAELLERIHVDIIKGNASEIARLAGEDVVTKGVETSEVSSDPAEIVRRLARARSAVAVITGKEDFVSDGSRVFVVRNGHAMMGAIVGTGCMAASVIGAFAGVERDRAMAAAAALACYGIAGELAAARSSGPGSFKTAFYDEAYALDSRTVRERARVDERTS
jgi:hydroxyethylthiazole kinase